jgi:hypothetical protein
MNEYDHSKGDTRRAAIAAGGGLLAFALMSAVAWFWSRLKGKQPKEGK